MDDETLKIYLSDLESDMVERKASDKFKEKICRAICAFANDMPNHGEPGVIFIGANDNGSCSNINVTDDLLKNLSNFRSDGNILPLPSLEIQKRTLDGCEMAIIIVHPALKPPVKYKQRAYVRVGPTTRLATDDEALRLSERCRGRDIPYELQPVTAATIADLNDDLIYEYLSSAIPIEILENNHRSKQEQLEALRLLANTNGEIVPTVLGILLTCNEPSNFIGGAYVQFLRIGGLVFTDPIKDASELRGPVQNLFRLLDDKFKAHNSVATDFTKGSTEETSPEYPLPAFQQLVRNALIHRSYEGTNAPVRINWFNDRIEIQNYGGPYGRVNRENFGKPYSTDYRNLYLASALKELGYIQKFGFGIETARHVLAENKNPDLEFQVEENQILAIMRKRR